MSSTNNIETEYLEITRKAEWPTLFLKIRAQSSDNNYTCKEAVKPQNNNLNRYRDVSPYDHSRIVLNKGSTDYINANLITIDRAHRSYILTQGPLVNTVSHFWLMVWEANSKAIIMLNKLIEKKQEKCFQYWPAKIGAEHILQLDDVGLRVEYLEQNDYSYYLIRTFRLTECESGQAREIKQFHYTTWPDFGVPGSPTVFLEFLKKIRGAGVLEAEVGPSIVHCSAGIGRSGTFCVVDSTLVLIEKDGQNSVDVKEIVLEMRKSRMGLIQTHEQLRFSYQAIIEGAKKLSQQCPDNENCNSDVTNNHSGGSGGSVTPPVLSQHSSDVEDEEEEEEEEAPPPPPPRTGSLRPPPLAIVTTTSTAATGGQVVVVEDDHQQPPAIVDRPLPNIPNSTSLSEFSYEGEEDEDSDSEKNMDNNSCPSGPLPVVPSVREEGSSEDELEDDDDIPVDDDDDEEDEDEDSVGVDDRTESPYSEKSENILTNDYNENDRISTTSPLTTTTTLLSSAAATGGGGGNNHPSGDVENNSTTINRTTNNSRSTTTTTNTLMLLSSSQPPVPRHRNTTTAAAATAAAAVSKRHQRNEVLASQVRDMKRRQQASEHWTQQLKRSLYRRRKGVLMMVGVVTVVTVVAVTVYHCCCGGGGGGGATDNTVTITA